MIISQIDVLLIGQPKPFHADGTMSAMARMPVDRPIFLGKHGFAGDQVADPTVHGGADKAVHFYPAEHYPKWIAHFGDRIEQLHAAGHDWTIARTFHLLIGGGHRAAGAKSALQALTTLETLADSWRSRAAKLAG